MIVSGLSGNEIYCLALKGYAPGEIAIGNSVCSLGVLGGLGAFGRGIAGGEVEGVTRLISEGRHQAIHRMEEEARKVGANGVSGVSSELRTLAGYTEFLAQGTAIHHGPADIPFFSTASTGMQLYCHLDAGYVPVRFCMGNVAYALGIGRGITGSLRTMARGEVREFSQMYNHIRHLALERLKREAAEAGANAVVDIQTRMLPYGGSSIELLMTGTAALHPALPKAPVKPSEVRTSELSGEELWNLAHLGMVPVQLVMATSVYSLGVVGGIGTLFQGMSRGELPELTSLIYGARENVRRLLAEEAAKAGGEQVIGNRLSIRELGPGLIEVVAIGTAVRRQEGFAPKTEQLPPQAIIVERSAEEQDSLTRTDANPFTTSLQTTRRGVQGVRMFVGLAIVAVWVLIAAFGVCGGLISSLSHR